jgi:chemotaxis family two-component system response regulator Rcp1
MTRIPTRAVRNVLLVEDNPGDVDLVLEVLSEGDSEIRCTVASDGVEALRLLRESPRYHLILLDLNIPRKDGRAVLAEIKADPVLRAIPVVVLTSSEAERDLVDVYRLHGNCFLTKPVDLDAFQKVVAAIDQFWLHLAKLPALAS